MPNEKKSERLEVRLGHSEKLEFVQACDSQGETSSGALRRFIRGYVRRAKSDFVGEANRRLFRRYGGWVGSAALVVTILIFGVVETLLSDWRGTLVADAVADYGELRSEDAISPINIDPDDAGPALQVKDFNRWDRNGDGLLSRHEILPNDDGLHRVLDLDSNGISPAEFWAKGRMTYIVADHIERAEDDMFPSFRYRSRFIRRKIPKTQQMIEFDLSGSVPNIAVFDIPVGQSMLMTSDRTVFWETNANVAKAVFSHHDYRPRNSVTE